MEASPTKKAGVLPEVSVMVNVAITTLARPKGSSLHAIKKYISENYNADVQKLSVYINKYLKFAVESGVIVQTSGKGARGSFTMSIQKIGPKPNTSKMKPVTSPKMQTSTPKKNLKAKKHFAPENSPSKELKITSEVEVASKSSFPISEKNISRKPRVSVATNIKKTNVSRSTKVKKSKIIAKKVEDSNISVSPKEKFENTMVSSKHAKDEDGPKSVKTKTTSTPERNIDDEEVSDDSTFIISEMKMYRKPRVSVPTKTRKMNSSRLSKVKNIQKLLAKEALKPDASVSPKEKLKYTMDPSKHFKNNGAPKETEKTFTTEKRSETTMNFTDEEQVPADTTYIVSETKISRKTGVAATTKSVKSNMSLQAKIKEPKKLKTKDVKELNASESSKMKHKNTMASSKHKKIISASKSVKTKKNAQAMKHTNSVVKNVMCKNTSLKDVQV